MAAQAVTLLREVARLEAPLEELRALQSVVHAVPLHELREQAAELRLGPLFSLLNENNREQTALCVSILERLLQAVGPVHVARNLRVDLQRGLTHPDDSVKTLTLSQDPHQNGFTAQRTFLPESPANEHELDHLQFIPTQKSSVQ